MEAFDPSRRPVQDDGVKGAPLAQFVHVSLLTPACGLAQRGLVMEMGIPAHVVASMEHGMPETLAEETECGCEVPQEPRR